MKSTKVFQENINIVTFQKAERTTLKYIHKSLLL